MTVYLTRTFFLGSLLVLPLFSTAQVKTDRAEVAWGEPREEKKHGRFSSVRHRTDDHVYVTVDRKEEPWLQLFDQSLHMLKEQALPMEMGKDDHEWETMLFQDERILFFTSVYDKGDDSKTLYVREYGMSDLAPRGTLKKVHSIRAERKKDQGWFAVSERPTGNGFQVKLRESGLEDGDKHRKVMLFGDDLELESEFTENFELPWEDDRFVTDDVFYDDDGSKLVVGRLYPEKQERRERRREGKPTYDQVLLMYAAGASRPEVHTIQVQDKFLQDMTMLVPDDKVGGDILCAGFWGNKGSWSVRGAFFMRLDRDSKEIVHQSFKEFDNEFITAYMTEKEEKKATKKAERKGEELEMYEYDLDEIVMRDDGGAVLVGEQYFSYVTTHTVSSPNGGTTTYSVYHYVYNDIVAVNVDPEGNIEWAAKIPKRQHTTNDSGFYSSYALTVKGDKMYFVFNDSGKNLFLQKGQKVEQFEVKGKEALITLATIDGDGHVHREALFSPEKQDAILQPRECFQMEDDRMFIYAVRKKDYRYGMITFD